MKCKSLAGVIVALGALASMHPAYAWDWYHTPIRIQNDTSSTWTHIHNDAGWYAKIEPMDGTFPGQVAPGQSLNTLATWRYTGNGWDNDNAAELFFTVNGMEHSLQIKGNESTGESYMYIRFCSMPGGLSDDIFEFGHVELMYDSTSSKKDRRINDGYEVSEGCLKEQSTRVSIDDKR
jgi:hypothetical protein